MATMPKEVHIDVIPDVHWETLTAVERPYGVIVGIARDTEPEVAGHIKAFLSDEFPGVHFCVIAGASSVAFPLPREET
jgi:hypothetical protein